MYLVRQKHIYNFLTNNFRLESIYCLTSICIMLVTCLPPFRSLSSISASLKGYYYVNYFDLGLIKRGFIGSIYKIFEFQELFSPSILVLLSHLFFLIIFGFIFWIFAKSCFKDWNNKQKIPFYSLFTLSPVLFLRLGYDIGRMDLICLVLSLLTIIFTTNNSYSYFSKAILISLSVSIQLLIHEGSLLLYSPLISCLYIYKYKIVIYSKFKKLLPLLLIPLLVGLTLLFFGRYEPGREALNLYLNNINSELDSSMNVELIHTLKESFIHGFSLLTLKSFFGGSYIITIYYFFILYLVFKFIRLPLYLKLSIFTPLLLSFIARDHTRFLAASTICCNLLILISAKESRLDCPRFFGIIFYIFLFAIFFIGPWGIGPYDPLPLIKHYSF